MRPTTEKKRKFQYKEHNMSLWTELGSVDHATRGEQASTVSATRCFNLEKDDEASLAQLKIAQLFRYNLFIYLCKTGSSITAKILL
jgi:hypothetical protein